MTDLYASCLTSSSRGIIERQTLARRAERGRNKAMKLIDRNESNMKRRPHIVFLGQKQWWQSTFFPCPHPTAPACTSMFHEAGRLPSITNALAIPLRLRLLCCDTYGQNGYTAWNAYWEVLQRYQSFLLLSMGSKKPVIRLHALAASASHVLQRDGVLAMQRMRDVCLAGAQGVLGANSKPWLGVTVAGKDLAHSYRSSCTRLPTGERAKGEGSHSSANKQPEPEPEATKDGAGEIMTQWPRRICV
ncbi:hypothetical protein NA56DRAFT_701994 [Hyaloscypha hepaticicola]|uniref:Uncharacterized protein n=1 Tax=Hyaloscypha hepaticicola TaxID=2082293 RepID=A0A2J6Q9F3_9HELO|nr:hypothetical protein NA56DRAFT_701994 [Hyaloscypha hepaticicola]